MKPTQYTKEGIKLSTNTNEDGCWVWQRSKNKDGYPKCWFRGRHMTGNRVSWLLFIGEIPSGMLVCHKCDNPNCINPEHLFLGTDKDNTHDCINKGRFIQKDIKGEGCYNAKLTTEKVVQARKEFDALPSCRHVPSLIRREEFVLKKAKEFGVSWRTLKRALYRETWRHC